MDNQTIYALSTVYGKSGVAVIRISGKDALAAVSRLTPLDVSGLKPRYAYFTNIYDSVSRETLDKCLLLYLRRRLHLPAKISSNFRFTAPGQSLPRLWKISVV